MSDPEVAVRYLVERYMRKAGLAPGGLYGPGDPDKLHEVVAAKLGKDSALKHMETAVARLRMAMHDAVDQDPRFAADLRAALARTLPVPGAGGMGRFGSGGGAATPDVGPGGRGGATSGPGGAGIKRYAVEDVWVDEKEQADRPEPGESSPRT